MQASPSGQPAIRPQTHFGFGALAFLAYLIGLSLSGISIWLAIKIGPFDDFAVSMIAIPGLVGLVGAAGIFWAAGPGHRRLSVLALILGAVWIFGGVFFAGAYASIGR